MINSIVLPKAYKEVLEILKYILEEEYNKIPKEIIQTMFQNMDREYSFKITSYEDFETKELLYETQLILAIFFRDYWATKEQKEKIFLYEKYQLEKIEQEKCEKYNVNDLFPNQSKALIVIKEEENWYMKILSFLKKIFKK